MTSREKIGGFNYAADMAYYFISRPHKALSIIE